MSLPMYILGLVVVLFGEYRTGIGLANVPSSYYKKEASRRILQF